MNNPLIKLSLFTLLMVGTMTQVSAQNGVTAADTKAIVDIFKGVDASKYRLVFNNGSEVYGSKAIKMADLKTLSRTAELRQKVPNGLLLPVTAAPMKFFTSTPKVSQS